MTFRVAPILPVPSNPCVGVFWVLGDTLLIDRSTLAEAEPYGDCLTHANGHYELWEQWQAKGSAGLRALGYPTKIMSSEYEAWPRGRVVFENLGKLFVIYADRRLQAASTITAIVDAFGLAEAKYLVRSDPHYRKTAPLV